ncbi:hypothetical protein M404DRAFT_32392 [Pisolithus tinctorius Marx 270]|uniref:Uncharacterized protein n=1 Tax=Pisolithus tinctorius Marx 270 TaxID=870435 RepID=A0A0C3IK12_PISTI|nr:hypothetical protein M404DRAFT_32392 [Pisolithus tinctorius Marx 270]
MRPPNDPHVLIHDRLHAIASGELLLYSSFFLSIRVVERNIWHVPPPGFEGFGALQALR